MPDKSENSVVRALQELTVLEEGRVRAEAAEREARERARTEREAAEERRRRQREAERERRERLEAEHRERDAAARDRILSLRAELAAVQTEREAMRQALNRRYEEVSSVLPGPVVSTGSVWLQRGALGLAACFVGGMGVFLLMAGGNGDDSRRMAPVKRTPETVPAAPERHAPRNDRMDTGEEAGDAVPPAVVGPAVQAPVAAPKKGGKPQGRGGAGRPGGARKGGAAKGAGKRESGSIIDNFDQCGDDPMCGFGLDEKKPGKQRKRRP